MDNILFKEIMYKGFLGMYLEKAGLGGFAFFSLMLLGYIACIVIPYFLGSINTAILYSTAKYKQDIRTFGSGNAGMTNMLRTFGKGAAAITLIGDALKAVLSAIIGRLIFGLDGLYIAGMMCIVGHVFPIYYRFKGGKGVITAAIMILMLNWKVFLILFAMFLLIVAATKYISLGSIMCALLFPVVLNRIEGPSFGNIIAILIAAFLVFLHRSNIKRLLNRTESKVSFKKKEKSEIPTAEVRTTEENTNEKE